MYGPSETSLALSFFLLAGLSPPAGVSDFKGPIVTGLSSIDDLQHGVNVT